MKGVTLFKGRHVYVVLEYHEPIVHAVFTKREYAEAKAEKLKSRHKRPGHISVLKMRLRGAEVQV